MRRIFIICFGLLVGIALQAQTSNPVDAPAHPGDDSLDRIFTKVEMESTFRGGKKGWADYLSNNIKYPKDAITKRIEGTVIIQFIVTQSGRVIKAEVIKSVHPSLDEEALRLIQESPNWNPARQNGIAVNSLKRQPIVFKLTR